LAGMLLCRFGYVRIYMQAFTKQELDREPHMETYCGAQPCIPQVFSSDLPVQSSLKHGRNTQRLPRSHEHAALLSLKYAHL
jgi:hypothetical protein